MAEELLAVGRDTDGWCTRCRMDLSHVIVAMVGADVKRAQCKTCGSVHKYYAPKNQAKKPESARRTVVKKAKTGDRMVVEETAAPRPAKKSTAKKSTTKRAAPRTPKPSPSLQRWNEEVRPLDNPDVRRYSPRDTFEPDELLRHSKFGVGKVLSRKEARKILVLFRDGEKLLITGLGQ